VTAGHSDLHRFDRWARTYDRHWLQPLLFEPIHRTTLELAAAEVARPAAILDIGCGTGRLLRSAAVRFPAAKLVGVDATAEMVKQAERALPAGSSIRFQHATAEELPFPDTQFDLVFSTLTFHHWSDQARGVAEVARVLAPGGRWLLADFVADGLMKTVRRLLRLTQFPDRQDLNSMLATAGLQIVSERHVRRLGGQVPVLAIVATSDAG
jgi:ubiquinone/menaquinone biosynthesis C-methylase UbiE